MSSSFQLYNNLCPLVMYASVCVCVCTCIKIYTQCHVMPSLVRVLQAVIRVNITYKT